MKCEHLPSYPIVRTALLAMASTRLSLRPLPDKSPPKESLILSPTLAVAPGFAAIVAVDCAARPWSLSYADSRSTVLSYTPATEESAITCLRSAAVMGPMRLAGGST